MLVTVGGGVGVGVGVGVNVNRSLGEVADVPPGVVTVRSTVPEPAGLVVLIAVAEDTVKVAVTAPNFTELAPVKFVPATATAVPPVSGPLVGLRLATVGNGTKVN
jgi:hypothetical protein